MSGKRNHLLHAFMLALWVGGFSPGAMGCAGFGILEAQESPPLPATIEGLRAAIEAERTQLKEYAREPTEGPEPLSADDLIAVADRLSRLHAKLEQLERDAGDQTTAP